MHQSGGAKLMRRGRHYEDASETLAKILLSFAVVPVVLVLFIALSAGCFTVVWHIGHWVNWW